MKTRARRLVVNVLLSLAAVAGTLLAAELALRRALPERVLYLEALRVHAYSEVYGWIPRPGGRGRVAGAWTTINQGGYRGALHPPQPTPGLRRVVMLGDSIAFGYGVTDGSVFTDLLERPAGLEVVNLSVIGYGTDQALIRLEREGLGYGPHVVVLNFCVDNDVRENAQPHTVGYPKPYFLLVDERLLKVDRHLRLSPRRRAHLWLSTNSVVFSAYRLLRRKAARPPPPTTDEAAVNLTVKLLERMHEVSGASGARFLVLLHPGASDFQQPQRIQRLLEACPPVLDVRDLRPLYGNDRAVFGRYADSGGHLNEEGHRRLAQALREMLR